MHYRAAICCVILATSLVLADNPPAVKPLLANGDFESSADKLEHWGFFSRTNSGGATLGTEACQGRAAARVQSTGKDWALTNDTRIAVKEGRCFIATARIKGKGRVQLAIVGYLGKERVSWDIGSGTLPASDQWNRLVARVLVPAGIDTIMLRFVGQGETDVLIDDVLLADEQFARPVKPLVQGYATQRVKEILDRGVVAVPADKAVQISWRLLETDPADVAFNVYRQVAGGQPARLNKAPVAATTDFVDSEPAGGEVSYFVRAIAGSAEAPASPAATVQKQPWVSIKLPLGDTVQKIAFADLDGDGKLDFVVKTPNSNVDPYEKYWKKSPGTYKLHAVRHDGKLLWTHDMGWSIEQGIWYSPYLVFDFDGDGKAEVVLKAGVGDPRDPDGRVTSGEEFVLILNGETGKELARANWPSRDGFPSYNYYCRNQLGLAFLDGKTPCLLVERGTYNTIKLDAYQLRRASAPQKAPASHYLNHLWSWTDSEDLPGYRGQGAHCLRAADLDGDGRDEILLGCAAIDDNGVGLWTTRKGHPDFTCIGDLDPLRPGMEIVFGMETRQPKNGICMVDAKTGKLLWGLDAASIHIHGQGLTSDIDPAHPGIEVYGGERDEKEKRYLFNAQGKLLVTGKDLGGLAPRGAYWTDQPYRSLLAKGNQPIDLAGKKIGPAFEGAFVAVADVLGDWREEVITTMPDGELRIYTTTIPAKDRRVTFLQDPIYRNDLATAAQAYYQMPSVTRLPSSK